MGWRSTEVRATDAVVREGSKNDLADTVLGLSTAGRIVYREACIAMANRVSSVRSIKGLSEMKVS